MTAVAKDETRVSVIEVSASGDPTIDDIAAALGEYVVYGYTEGKDGDDPDGRPYYLLDRPCHDAGGCWWAYPEPSFRPRRRRMADETASTSCDYCDRGEAIYRENEALLAALKARQSRPSIPPASTTQEGCFS